MSIFKSSAICLPTIDGKPTVPHPIICVTDNTKSGIATLLSGKGMRIELSVINRASD